MAAGPGGGSAAGGRYINARKHGFWGGGAVRKRKSEQGGNAHPDVRSRCCLPILTYAHAVVFGSVHGHPSTPIFVFCSLTGFICTSGLPCPHLAQSRFWMTLSTEGTAPIPRDSHVSVIHGQSMYVFGGSTGSAMNDFHELRLDKCRWQQVGDGSLVARFRLAL